MEILQPGEEIYLIVKVRCLISSSLFNRQAQWLFYTKGMSSGTLENETN